MNHISKLPHIKTSIFTKMSALARAHNAINLSQGFPDFPSDPKLIELFTKAMKDGYNQYAPMQGSFVLREQLALKFEKLYRANYNPETEITITSGATQAIFTIISTFIHEKDEVILFKPAYDCYEPAIKLHKGKPIAIQLEAPNYKVDWQEVKAALSAKTKMIIINTPHNPCGTVWSTEDLKALENIVKGTDIIVLSDEVYEHIIFDGQQHQSVCLFPSLKEQSFIVASFGKTFHNTGWKMGYCVAPVELMREYQKVHQYNVFSANHPMQIAIAEYLKDSNNYLYLPDFYQKKRDFFLDAIKDSKFEFVPSGGTYFQLLTYKNISTERDIDFAKNLVINHGIAAIPISVFNVNNYDPKMLRFCFSKEIETLEKAAEIICSI